MSLVCFQILAISRPALWYCWILCVAFCWTASAGGVESNKSRSRSVSKLVDASLYRAKIIRRSYPPLPSSYTDWEDHNIPQPVPVRSSWGISALRWSRCGPGVSCAPCVAAPVEDVLLSKPRRLDRDVFAVSILIYLEYSWMLMNIVEFWINDDVYSVEYLSYLSLLLICSLRALHIAAFQVIADSRTSTHGICPRFPSWTKLTWKQSYNTLVAKWLQNGQGYAMICIHSDIIMCFLCVCKLRDEHTHKSSNHLR